MGKKILLAALCFLSFSLLSFSQTKKPKLLEEIDYFRIYYGGDPNKIITVQNVETDWGKLGLKGYVKKMKSCYVRGGVEADIEYFYFNTDGNLIKFEGEELNKISNKKIPVVIDYIYNDKGQAIQIVENKGGQKRIKNIQYSGDILVSATYHKNGMVASYGRDNYVFRYNEKGQIIEVENSGEKMDTPHYFEYDRDGKCIKEVYSHRGPITSVQSGKKVSNETCYIFKYTYNNAGDIDRKDDSESHNVNKNFKLISFHHNYTDYFTYDNIGNWISSVYKKREFVYYTDDELKGSESPTPVNEIDTIPPLSYPPNPPLPPTIGIHKIRLSCEDKKYGISDNTPIFWNGKIGESFQTGEGTVESPYIIAFPSQLAYLAKCVNDGNTFEDKYFVLVNDLDLGGRGQAKFQWEPIGSAKGTYFGGHFYGNNRTISNMHRTTSGVDSYAGLFGTVGKAATVSEIIIDKTSSLKGWVIGGIAAYNEGYIEACRSSAKCEGSDIGGIVGINKGIINNCISNAYLQSPMYTAGGISAKNGGVISQSAYKGNIVFNVTSKYCGGIIGEMLDGGTVTDCYYIGNISTEFFSLRTGIGGLVGSKNLKGLNSISIKNSYSAGTGNGSHIVPDYKKNIEHITNCFFDIDIKALGKSENKELTWFQQNGAKSTVEMKSHEIISSLNQDNNAWLRDDKSINKGYPILSIENNNKSHFVECKSTISVSSVTGRRTRKSIPNPPPPVGEGLDTIDVEVPESTTTRPESKTPHNLPIDTIRKLALTQVAKLKACSKSNPCKIDFVVLNDLKYWDVESVVITHLKNGSPSFDITVVGKEDIRNTKSMAMLFVTTTALNVNSYILERKKTGITIFPRLAKGERKVITLVYLAPHLFDTTKFAGLAFYLHNEFGFETPLYDTRWQYIYNK